MNRSLPGFKLDKATQGFLQYKAAEALSPRTLESYESHLKKWAEHTGDGELAHVTTQDLRAYLAWLRAEYKPHRFSGDSHPPRAKNHPERLDHALGALHLGGGRVGIAQSDEGGAGAEIRRCAGGALLQRRGGQPAAKAALRARKV